MAALYLYLNLVALALVAWSAMRYARVSGRRAEVSVVAVLLVVAVVAIAGVLDSRAIPLGWITGLQEGRTLVNVQQLAGQGGHGGANHVFLVQALAGFDDAGMRDAVRLSLLSFMLVAILLVAIARTLSGSLVVSVIVVAAALGGPPGLNGAFSEQSGLLAFAYLLLAVPAIAVLERRPTRRDALLATLTLIACAVLAALTREESIIVSGVVLVALGPVLVSGLFPSVSWPSAIGRRLAALVRPTWVQLLLLLALAIDWQLPTSAHETLGWARDALHPINPSILTLPAVLSRLALPLGLVMLAGVATLAELERPTRRAAALVALATLYKLYFTAGHLAAFEYHRYAINLLPLVALAAAMGWGALAGQARQRGWTRAWPVVALALLAAFSLAGPRPLGPAHALGDTESPAFPLDYDQQRELRFLLAATEREPACVFVTRVTHANHVELGGYDYVAYDPASGRIESIAESPAVATLDAAADAIAPHVRCVRFVEGLDCNLATAASCEAIIGDRAKLEELTFPAREYNWPSEYGEHRQTVRLAIYRIRG